MQGVETAHLVEKLQAQAQDRDHQSAEEALAYLIPLSVHFGRISAPFDVVRSAEQGLKLLYDVLTEPEPVGERRVSTTDLWHLIVRLECTELAFWRGNSAIAS